MIKLIKYGFYALVIIAAGFLYWFLPKYNFVHNNPQYCVNLSPHIYYCGTASNLEQVYKAVNK